MSKLRHLIRCISFISVSAFANLANIDYYPASLVAKISEDSAKTALPFLKDDLHKLISTTHSSIEDYKKAREYLFGHVDLEASPDSGEYFIKDRYCEFTATKEHGVGKGKIPNHNIINCEHTWPQSRFSKTQPENAQKNDLHHLFAVYSKANSSRSNLPFGEVSGNVVGPDCESSYRGVMLSNSSIKSFEPPTEHKGNVARALFYFSTRYKVAIEKHEEEYLRAWHREDPVDQAEIERNNKVYSIQSNRNPYIDDSSLVDRVKDF